MNDTYDVIVIGSGHNGLIAGAYLAKSGQKVLVLERNETYGGGVATKEVAAPGFFHDIHSNTHVFIQANPLIINDELGLKSKFGLTYEYPDAFSTTIFDDQTCLTSFVDLDKTCESIAKFSAKDAETYRKFAEKSLAMMPMIFQGLFVPPPPQGVFWSLLDQSQEGQFLMQAMQRSMLDLVNQMFENEKVKIHFTKFGCELFVSPDERGTGAILATLPGFMHATSPGIPVGGSAALVNSLIRCLESFGADIRHSSEVKKVMVENCRATGVELVSGQKFTAATCVIGQIHPWLLPSMVDGLDPVLIENAKNTITSRFIVMANHYALKEEPKYVVGDEPHEATMIGFACSDFEAYLRVFDEFRYGKFGNHPLFSAILNSHYDQSRVPELGNGALTIWRMVPFELADGGSAAWDDVKEKIAEEALEEYRRYAPNVTSDNIVGQHVDSPLDMQRYNATFQRGDVGGVGKYFFQMGGHRPTPELAQYAVPGVEALYLAGTFMHPPGGVTGGGRATAIKICEDLDIDFDKLIG